MRRIDPQEETRILALLARGDTYQSISDIFHAEGKTLTLNTIGNIKQRNAETLKYMKDTLIEHELDKSTQLLTKSRQLLERKLARAFEVQNLMDEVLERLNNEEITPQEYDLLAKQLRKDDLSVPVLTALTKEMFNQSQISQNKPTSITESPAQAKENLKTLLQAIDNKDEKQIVKALFPADA